MFSMIQKNFCDIIEWDPLGRWGRITKSEDNLTNKDILPWAFSFGLRSWSISTSYSKSINPGINRSGSVRACCRRLSLWRIKILDEALNLLMPPHPVGFVMAYPARSIWCITLGKGKGVVVFRVSSFLADSATEATFIKSAGHSRPSDKERPVAGTS